MADSPGWLPVSDELPPAWAPADDSPQEPAADDDPVAHRAAPGWPDATSPAWFDDLWPEATTPVPAARAARHRRRRGRRVVVVVAVLALVAAATRTYLDSTAPASRPAASHPATSANRGAAGHLAPAPPPSSSFSPAPRSPAAVLTGTGYALTVPPGFRDATGSFAAEPGGISADRVLRTTPVDGVAGTIGIVRVRARARVGLAQTAKLVRQELEHDGAVMRSTGATTAAGTTALTTTYTFTAGGRAMLAEQVAFVHGAHVFFVTGSAIVAGFPAVVRALNRVLTSWRW